MTPQNTDPVYLDHAATTPMRPEAIAAMASELGHLGNPSSLHAAGRRARRVVEESREQLAEGFEAIEGMDDLVFHTLDVMDALGLERADVVGLSLGGGTVFLVDENAPESWCDSQRRKYFCRDHRRLQTLRLAGAGEIGKMLDGEVLADEAAGRGLRSPGRVPGRLPNTPP